MDKDQRLNLKNMIKEYNSEETTDTIRQLKHSKLIRTDILKLNAFKRKYSRLGRTNKAQYKSMAEKQCAFLYKNYTNIFHRHLKNELDMKILLKFVEILERIEDGDIDQHDGSFEVGSILKKLFIDSALRQDNKREKGNKKKKQKRKKPINNITWAKFKMMQLND